MSINRFPATAQRGATPATCDLTHHHWLGWEDARCGRPWHQDYDTWAPRLQLTYEWGRQRAAASYFVRGRKPRRWLRSEPLSLLASRARFVPLIRNACPERFFMPRVEGIAA